MKRLIYVIVACVLFSIFVHAKRMPRWLDQHPDYFATAPTFDADSITIDEFYGDKWETGHIVLRSPAIAKGDTIWMIVQLSLHLDCTKQDFTCNVFFDYDYKQLPDASIPLDSTQQKIVDKELRRIFSKDIIFRNTTFDDAYKFYEKYYEKPYMPDSTQCKQLSVGVGFPLFLIPPAEKATETQTEAKQ